MIHFSNAWRDRFLQLGRQVSTWSKDPSTKVGAVIIRPNKTISSLGYNGFPRGVKDDAELYANREYKYPRVVHAEANAILNCAERPEGHHLFVWPFGPCVECAKLIIQSGIASVTYPKPTPELMQRWGASYAIGQEMFQQAGIRCEEVFLE